MIKWLIGFAVAIILVGVVLDAYAQQVGPCHIVTIVNKDGSITNCTVCGTIVNCF